MFTDDRLANELRRLARRLEKCARANEELAKHCQPTTRAALDGGGLAYRHSARILKAAARGEKL
jgi:hypothetical protein